MKHRRTIVKVLLLLLAWGAAGATLNIAVAWGCLRIRRPVFSMDALRAQPVPPAELKELGVEAFFSDLERERSGGKYLKRSTLFVGVAEWQYQPRLDRQGPQNIVAVRIDAGWPRLAMKGLTGLDPDEPRRPPWPKRDVCAWQCGLMPLDWPRDRLPYGIIWPGFAINTVFYAGVLWVLCCGPFALRRMIRRRPSQCAQCAYPVGGSPVCTECGAGL